MLTLDSYLKTVSFEIAKGLKDIGFFEPCLRRYETWRNKLHKRNESDPTQALNSIDFDSHYPCGGLDISDDGLETWRNSEKGNYVAAPTIEQVIKYVYNSHGVFISAAPDIGVHDGIDYVFWKARHQFRTYNDQAKRLDRQFTGWEFPLHLESREDALEYGIKKFIKHRKLVLEKMEELAAQQEEE